MRRFVLPSAVVCIAVGLIALLAFGIQHQGENLSLDSQVARGHYPLAPDATLSLPLLGTSRRASLADFRGKVVVLNIFASWCDPCQAEAPVLRHEQHLLAGRPATVLGVTYEDAAQDARRFMAANHLTYPALQDVSGTLVHAFGTDAVPETFVIDPSGRIVAVRRYMVTERWLASAVAKAFANPPADGARQA
jgi:cytochrome c biogenesis protein CcmG/thiol:disulfide interchange protein DsbE